jgi:magnesium transporter
MPELKWRGGYFLVLGLMLGIAIIMTFWFRKKGWFEK